MVYVAWDAVDCKRVAVKKMILMNQESAIMMNTEGNVMRHVNHDNVLKVVQFGQGIHVSHPEGTQSRWMFLALELA